MDNSTAHLQRVALATAVAAVGATLLFWYSPLRNFLRPRTARIQRLFLHPLKGGAPVEVQELRLDEYGFQHDRRWAVFDSSNGIVTAKTCPKMVLIRSKVISGPALLLSAPDMPSLEVPLPAEGALIEFELWTVPGRAMDCGPDAAKWLREFLGMEARLAYLSGGPGTKMREMCTQRSWNDGDEAKSVYFPGSRVSMVDSTKGTLLSWSSVQDLNRRLKSKLSIERFRMNIILEGTRPYEEEQWTSFSVGQKEFVMERMCNRCVVTLVDPQTAERGVQPLQELRSYKSFGMLPNSDARHGTSPILGMKFGGSCQTGVIRVGDEVKPLTLWKPGDRKY